MSTPSSKTGSARPESTIDTYSQEWRHQCLVRRLIRLRLENREQTLVELNGDGKRWLGYKTKSPQVYEDVLQQWRRGNRGNPGEWHERDQ